MPNVSVPKTFFVKERRAYSNWQFAFWREFFQNSVDAGARNIKIDLVDMGNRKIHVGFDDDGCGMTREVLESVYFQLGATTKDSGASVGGFGRARILTCFSMESYSIHTLNSLVQGNGGAYEVADVDPRKGCLVQVEMENESFSILEGALHSYLGMSQLACNVTINGNPWKTWSYRRQQTRTLDINDGSFADVYVNKSAPDHRLLIRVNGTVMYSHSIRAKAQVIVEINPYMAREVLTSNRDGMHDKYRAILDSFIEELSINTLSSLDKKIKRKDDIAYGGGFVCTRSRHKAPPLAAAALSKMDHQPLAVATGVGSGITLFSPTVQSITTASPSGGKSAVVRISEVIGGPTQPETQPVEAASYSLAENLAGTKKEKVGDKFAVDLPDVHIVDETDNEKVRRVIESYNPKNWTIQETQGKTYRKGGSLYKLLLLWKIACQESIDALIESVPTIKEVYWSFGWIFSDTIAGRCSSVGNGKILLINPVKSDGNMAFSIVSKKDRKKIMAIAKHEVAHIIANSHDEEYASLLTDIDGNFDEKECFRKMQEKLATVP